MKTSRLLRISVTAVAISSGAQALAQPAETPEATQAEGAAAPQDQESGADAADQSEIIVTAQRREERLVDVPISISVLGGREMDRATDRGVSEALNRTPNVVSLSYGGSERFGGQTSIVVRGLSVAGTTSSPTAFYLDSLPFGFIRSSFTPDANAYDLDRIEVLRGPQGTLYGASALSGVVRVLTNDPDPSGFDFKLRTSVATTKRGAPSYRGDVAVNLPLVTDKLAVRGVLGFQHVGGWVDKPTNEDANDRRIANARIKLLAKPVDRLTLGLSAWISRTDFGAPSYSGGPGSVVSRWNNPSLLDESGNNDFDAYSGTIAYEFDAFSVRSATSYIDYKTFSVLDIAAFAGPGITLDTRGDSRVFAQEINVSSNRAGPWRWSFGSMYRNARDYAWQARNTAISPNEQETTSKSIAVFGELGRSFLDGKFDLGLGLRYFVDRVQDRELSFGGVPGGIPPGGLVVTPTRKFEDLAPRAVLSWHPNEDLTVYASYGKGFRSGLNQLFTVARVAPEFPPAEPDSLKNYEVGFKGSAWNRRINFDAAVFYMDWTDVQQPITVLVLPPNVFESALVNAGSASGFGAEVNVSIEPVDNLNLGANLGWNDLEVDSDVFSGTGALVIGKGERLIGTPTTTANVFADYRFPLGTAGLHGRVSASANYISKFQNVRSLTAAFQRDAALTARASFALESKHWIASVFADNLTNEKGYTPDLVRIWDTYLRPRTIGLQLEYRY